MKLEKPSFNIPCSIFDIFFFLKDRRKTNIEQGISNFEGNTHFFASIGRMPRRFQRVSPGLPNPQVRIETYQAHRLPAVGRFLFLNDLASSSSWGMIVSAGFPRSELDLEDRGSKIED